MRSRGLALLAALSLLATACSGAVAPTTPASPTGGSATASATAPSPGPTAGTTASATPTTAASADPTPSQGASRSAIASPPAEPSPSEQGYLADTVRIAMINHEGTLTPFDIQFGFGLQMLYLIYDTVMYTDVQNVPQPLIATSVDVSADAMVYDITLRSGMAWHDGEPFTAADVKFAYEFTAAASESTLAAPLAGITAIEVTSDDTLTITLDEPDPAFPQRALAVVPIIPEHIWADVDPQAADEFRATIGSGAYRLMEADPETGYRMEANPQHFTGTATVRELRWVIIDEQNAALQALTARQVDALARTVPAEQIDRFSQPPLAVSSGPGFGSQMVVINNERPPLDRPEVRRAIDLAIDKQALVDTLVLGAGISATPGFLHPALPAHDPAVVARFDPDAAREALDDLGATAGDDGVRVLDGEAMAFELLTYSNDPIRSRAAELIVQDLGDVGISATVTSLDPAAVDGQVWPDFDVANGRDFDLAMWGWSAPIHLDPTRLVDLVHSDPVLGAFNVGGFRSDQADDLGNLIRVTGDAAERAALVSQLEALIADETPFVMLYFPDGIYGYDSETYDGWVFQNGIGIFTRLSFLRGLGS